MLSEAPSAHLETIIVGPQFRGIGLGRRLLQHTESEVRARGAGSLTLHVFRRNERAHSLYQSFGFDGFTTRSPLFVVSSSQDSNGVFGKVGIGTKNVSDSVLTVLGDISSSGDLHIQGNISASNISGVHTLGGKLGINVASPNYQGQIHSTGNTNFQITNTTTGTGATDGLVLGVGNTTQDGYLWNYENSDLYFATNNSERLRIQNDGNVGIGTTSPTKALQVEGDISASGDIYLDNDKSLIIKNAGGTDVNVLKVDTNNDTILSAPTNEELKLVTNPNATTEGIKFYTDGGTTPNVFIQDGGKVGIGTSSPAGVLQVTSDGSNKFFGVFSASTGAGAYKFYQDSNSHMALYGYNSSGTANVVINTCQKRQMTYKQHVFSGIGIPEREMQDT